MRRTSIPAIRKHVERDAAVRILDVASGPGSLTRDLALTFPNAHLTAYDLSFPYLKEAQRRLSEFARVDFVQGNAETLPFQDGSFEVVTCCFLFHELPEKARENVIRECLRVKAKDGVLVLTDSIQYGDAPQFDWALDRFPIGYHEPFFKNYLQNPLEDIIEELTGVRPQTSRGLFSKSISTTNGLKSKKRKSKTQSPPPR